MDAMKMDRLKQCELDMLRAFIVVCDQLNLKYFLVEGTLLGAVRHHGFIPWDDDIDVAMPREDYERFLRDAQSLLPSYYFIQSIRSEPEYHANFAKIRDCRTTYIESSVKNRPINHGVYIDIFPLDFVPARRMKYAINKWHDRICGLRVSRIFTLPPKNRRLMYRIAWIGGVVLSYCLYPQFHHAVIAREKLYTACRSSSMVINYCSAWRDRECMPVEWYGKGTTLEFEGLTVCVPAEYEKWLTQVYGDYMQLPPIEQRIGHHYAEVIDLDHSYTAYMKLTNNK